MAKRKSPQKRKYKRRKKTSSFKKIIGGIMSIGIISILIYCADKKDLYQYIPPSIQEELKKITDVFEDSASIGISADKLILPERLYDREEQIIHHTGFSVSYNEAWRIPNWTSYELTRDKTKGTVKRADHFRPDPRVLGVSATNQDYSRSGYDRGHMVPAADMKWSEQAMKESFYFTNICPQLHNLNAGDWKELEERVRGWAVKDSAIIVISGPIVSNHPKRIGVNKVAVPDAFYKIILSPYKKNPQAIGFIMKHQAGKRPLHSYAVTVDSIETVTGINFFPGLPEEVEKKVEGSFSLSEWGL